ncbi:MAG: hypothetical protein R3293_00850 [Candidatus Promineifilaceae bacterium]|nr:hypothetical protein [Candidatus Promineifilaceae bacterium]
MARDVPQHKISLPGELWGVTAYFNPSNSPLLLQNLAVFSRQIRLQGLNLLIVELSFGDAPFQVNDQMADRVVRRHSNTLLWHKERLLNLGVEQLPQVCDKVVWLDGDILFEHASWVTDVAQLLETYVVVQPFDTACWLPRGAHTITTELPRGLDEGHYMPGMAFTLAQSDNRRRLLVDYQLHGHTGFAWAARRSLLQRHQLYDRHILGGGDMVIAHSLFGDNDFWRGRHFYCRYLTKKELAVIAAWGRPLYEDINGSVFFVPGRVLHLWHGGIAGRSYLERLQILKENDYDPLRDIELDEAGCWRWSSDKPDLHRRARAYFAGRNAELSPSGTFLEEQ